MAFPIISSSPQVSFTKMLLPHEGSMKMHLPYKTKTWKSNFSRPTQCKATYDHVTNDRQTLITRRTPNFKPSIWTNDYIQSLTSEYKGEMYEEQQKVLREEVRMMLCKVENELHQLEFIDTLQRLGVAYHFNNEIRNILDNIHNKETPQCMTNLYVKALQFRLLRQHGYNVSTDVFVCFQDEMGKFRQESIDVEGMLSLYEASFHSFENETILDDARDFTTKFLNDYLNLNRGDKISLLISHALELPLHWRISRWEAKWYIDACEKQDISPTLLRFAKLDFNILQTIYHEDLVYTSRWWQRSGIGEKLSFVRNRLVENFVWTVGTNYKPEYQYFRKNKTKMNALITTIDDVYDTYGTLEELELFTEAIASWDLNGMENLPNYMKICFFALYNFVNEIAFDTLKETGFNITPYLKKGWIGLCKAYLIEAKWYHEGYIPSLEEYIENAWISISSPVILTHSYFLVPHTYNMEEFIHLEQNTNLIRHSAMILRLANDLGTFKREIETGDIPKSIQCYMHETGASEEKAREHVKSMMCNVWKEMNKEAHNSSFSQSFVDTCINFARMALCMYQHGDGHTTQDPQIKNRIASLLFQPIPIMSKQH